MVESAKLEVLESGNHDINSFDYQDDNGLNVNPYTMFLHAMKSVTKKNIADVLNCFLNF